MATYNWQIANLEHTVVIADTVFTADAKAAYAAAQEAGA